VLWAAAICDHHGWSGKSVIGHREHSSRKPDPGSTKMYVFRAAVNARLIAGPPGTPKPGGSMALDAGEITQVRAAVQAELEEYGARLWGASGTAGLFMRDVRATLDDHTQRLARIEDDTDDGTA
jgi:hypothetical protein